MSQQLSAKTIVNGMGVVAALIVVSWIGFELLSSDEPDICEGRYPVSTRFSLAGETGEPATPSELQARVGFGEWGLLSNGQIVEDPGSEDLVLAVSLNKGTSAGFKPEQTRGGASFIWRPAEMNEQEPAAACLSYRVHLPKDMQFGNGGTLPGLSMGTRFDPRGEPEIGAGAVARPSWNKEGNIFVGLQYATEEGWKNPVAVTSKHKWPLGRWVNVEQEIILNDVGKKNGIVRLWVDGKLAGEAKTLALRGDNTIALSTVMADIHYGSISLNAEAPEDTQIKLAPFVVRWQ